MQTYCVCLCADCLTAKVDDDTAHARFIYKVARAPSGHACGPISYNFSRRIGDLGTVTLRLRGT